jgi:hypothetical protein
LRKTVMSASEPNNCFNCGNVAMRFSGQEPAQYVSGKLSASSLKETLYPQRHIKGY